MIGGQLLFFVRRSASSLAMQTRVLIVHCASANCTAGLLWRACCSTLVPACVPLIPRWQAGVAYSAAQLFSSLLKCNNTCVSTTCTQTTTSHGHRCPGDCKTCIGGVGRCSTALCAALSKKWLNVVATRWRCIHTCVHSA